VSQQALLERLAEADAQADASVDNEAKAPSGALVGRASAVCAAMLEVLAAPIDADAAQKRFPSRLDRTLNTVLLHEVEAANGAIEALGAHLSRVAAALQGDLPLTQQLEEDAGALAAGRVPDAWRTAGGGVGRAIQSASAFLRAINARVGEVRAWASREDGTSPASVPLGALWHPQAFLTAVKQSFARRTGTAVDDVELKARVMSVVSPGADLEPPPDPPGGVYVHGLTVLGAEWDRENGELKDPAGTTLTSTIPMVWLRPVMVASSRPDDGSAAGPESVDDSVDAGEDASSVPVPVFVSSEREEQVTTFSMPSTPSLDREQWKLRGVCILCESLEQ
jgi:dynein heavy chain